MMSSFFQLLSAHLLENQVLNKHLKYFRGRGAGQLQRPTGVAVMPNGNYIAADYENKWISLFESNGKFINRIGVGKLLGPKGICVNKDGHIVVVDNKASSILIFQVLAFSTTSFRHPKILRNNLSICLGKRKAD